MTGLVLPRHVHAAVKRDREAAAAEAIKKSAIHRMDSDDFVTRKDVEDQLDSLQAYIDVRRQDEADYTLPHPAGWRIMVLMLTIPEKSAGGVIVVDDAKEQRSLSSPQGVVLDVGKGAYVDPDRFPDGAWVAVGDRITFAKYDASMFQLANGQRLGFLNDTQPISKIDNGWRVPA